MELRRSRQLHNLSCVPLRPGVFSSRGIRNRHVRSESGLHASRAMALGVQIRPLIRPANLSCVPCFPVSEARVPGVQGIDCPAVTAVQRSASRHRCFTSPQ